MESLPVYKDRSFTVEQRVEDLLDRMTTEEKLGQLRQELRDFPLYEKNGDGDVDLLPGLKAILANVAIGKLGIFLRADPFTAVTAEAALTPRQAAVLSNKVQRYIMEHTRLGIPILIGNDGNRCHLGRDSTILPSVFNMGCTWDPSLQEAAGHVIAVESRSRGETVNYAPNLDVIRDPRFGRSDQNYGEDPYLVGQLGAAMVRGLQGASLHRDDTMVAMLRAYPGVGDADGGHDFGETSRGPLEMQEFVLRPWKDAVEAGAEGIMVERAAYDGIPAPCHRYLMTELLRDQWGFKGITMGDAWDVSYLIRCRVAKDHREAGVMALKAGLDMNSTDAVYEEKVLGKRERAAYAQLADALEEGLVSMEHIDRSVRRMLRLKFLLGLFDDPYVDENRAEEVARHPDHIRLALHAARQSMVLLKNEKNLLPLSKTIGAVAVIGPNSDDEWAQLGDYAPAHRPEEVTTVLTGIREVVSNATDVHYALGCEIRDPSEEGFEKALDAARKSDLIVAVVGGSSKGVIVDEDGVLVGRRSVNSDCGESSDRATLDLLGVQEDLLKALKATGKPLIVVLIHGRAMSINWVAAHADAILDAGYPGEAGGTAVAETLFGDWNPGGRLTVSVPRHVGQLPVYYYARHESRPSYVDMDTTPLYPFGFGLSYTAFTYSRLQVSPERIKADETALVSVNVTNAGDVAGDEVVQLYIRDDICSVMRPWKQLKGFERVHLEPGETKTVTFPVGWDALCFYGMDGRWTVEPGTFTLMIGKHAGEDLLKTELTVD